MILNVYVVVDPKGDRPYVSTTLPSTLDKKNGIKVHHYILEVPDPVPPDTVEPDILIPEE